jgi:hypothetical protein
MLQKGPSMRAYFITSLVAILLAPPALAQFHFEQRNEVSYLRGPYVLDFYRRHNDAFRSGAAIHFAHGKQHDVLLSTPLREAQNVDRRTDREYVTFLLNRTARTEPEMFLYAPSTGQAIGRTASKPSSAMISAWDRTPCCWPIMSGNRSWNAGSLRRSRKSASAR